MKLYVLKTNIMVLLILCVACSGNNNSDDKSLTTPISFAGGLLDGHVRCCLSSSPDGHKRIQFYSFTCRHTRREAAGLCRYEIWPIRNEGDKLESARYS